MIREVQYGLIVEVFKRIFYPLLTGDILYYPIRKKLTTKENIMKKLLIGLLAFTSISSFAQMNNLENVGDIKTIKNEEVLREVLKNECLREYLVESYQAKIRTVVGQRLEKLTLKVEKNRFLGKHIVVDVEYIQPEENGNTIPAGTEIRCTMDLSKMARL